MSWTVCLYQFRIHAFFLSNPSASSQTPVNKEKFLADYNDGFVPGKLQPKKILQGEGIWMIFKFAFIEFKSENYLSHCHSTNYFAEKQVVKM